MDARALAHGDPSTPIEETVGAMAGGVRVRLTAEDLARIDEAAPRGVAAGERYAPEAMAAVNR